MLIPALFAFYLPIGCRYRPGRPFIGIGYTKSLRIVFQLSADFPYAFLQQNAARMLEVTMSKAKRSSAILIAAGLFTTPALAVGSDVARYPTAEAYKNYETTDACTSAVLNKRDGIGIRAPRVRLPLGACCQKTID
jgi:hypothetical protein